MKYKPAIDTIVYATDLGKNTRPVFRYAIDLARHYDAGILMLHVVEPLSSTARSVINTYLPGGVSEELEKNGMEELLATMKVRLQKFFEEECDDEMKLSVSVKEIIVVSGKPCEEILRIADDHKAGMIVMGKSSKKFRGSGYMGSSARRVCRHAAIPVFMIPTR